MLKTIKVKTTIEITDLTENVNLTSSPKEIAAPTAEEKKKKEKAGYILRLQEVIGICKKLLKNIALSEEAKDHITRIKDECLTAVYMTTKQNIEILGGIRGKVYDDDVVDVASLRIMGYVEDESFRGGSFFGYVRRIADTAEKEEKKAFISPGTTTGVRVFGIIASLEAEYESLGVSLTEEDKYKAILATGRVSKESARTFARMRSEDFFIKSFYNNDDDSSEVLLNDRALFVSDEDSQDMVEAGIPEDFTPLKDPESDPLLKKYFDMSDPERLMGLAIAISKVVSDGVAGRVLLNGNYKLETEVMVKASAEDLGTFYETVCKKSGQNVFGLYDKKRSKKRMCKDLYDYFEKRLKDDAAFADFIRKEVLSAYLGKAV